MSITLEDVIALEELETRLRAILPEQYQDSYEDVLPVSMGSAGLKFDADGHVAWNEVWASFCDLAMAGGPPHRGTLLEPASVEAVAATWIQVELCRDAGPRQPLRVVHALVPKHFHIPHFKEYGGKSCHILDSRRRVVRGDAIRAVAIAKNCFPCPDT